MRTGRAAIVQAQRHHQTKPDRTVTMSGQSYVCHPGCLRGLHTFIPNSEHRRDGKSIYDWAISVIFFGSLSRDSFPIYAMLFQIENIREMRKSIHDCSYLGDFFGN